MPVTASIAGLTMLPQIALGAFQTYQGFQGLNALENQPMPQYSVSPELQGAYNTAQGMTGQGYTGQERAGYLSNLQQANNTQYQRAKDIAGGNLAGGINAAIQSQNIGALNQFSMSDAALHRQNIQQAAQLAGQVQNQKNLGTEAQIADRVRREQAYGLAAQSGMKNIAGGISQGTALGVNAYQNQQYLDLLRQKQTPSPNQPNNNLGTEANINYNPYWSKGLGTGDNTLPYLTQPQ